MQLCVYTVSCMCRNRELSDICAADQLHEERKRSFNKRRGRSSAPFQGESTGLTENTVQVFYLHVTTSHSRGMRCCMLQRSRLVSLSDKGVRKEKTPILANLISWRMWVRLWSHEWSGAPSITGSGAPPLRSGRAEWKISSAWRLSSHWSAAAAPPPRLAGLGRRWRRGVKEKKKIATCLFFFFACTHER